jgi:uncharacterized protein (DUF58 family)
MTEPRRGASPLLDPHLLARVEGLPVAVRLIVEGYVAGLHKSPFQGFSIEFAEHREYVPGDDLRYVDWKVFGKSDRYYLKQFEEETNFACWLLVDISESMAYRSAGAPASKLEHARLIAATFAYLVLKQQDAVGLITFDTELRRFLRADGTATQLKTLCALLEQAPAEGETAIGPILHQAAERIKRRGLVVVISDLFDDLASLELGLKHLKHRRHDVLVLQVIDPAERDFAFTDLTLFKGLESVAPQLVDTRAIRDAYREEFERFLTSTANLCRDLRIDHALVRTDEPLDRTLRTLLSNRLRTAR